jgi:hypothetical protein
MNLKVITVSGLSLLCLNTHMVQAKKPVPFLKNKLAYTSGLSVEQHIVLAKKRAMELSRSSQKFSSPLAKTTAIGSRIIAYANRTLDGSSMLLIDTAKLYYTGDRGGDMKSDFVKFDSALSLTYDETLSMLRKDYRQTQTFDALNNISSGKGQVWNATSASYENENQSYYTSTVAKKRATDSSQNWDGSAWENSSKRIAKYDASNNIVTDSNFDWDGISWVESAVYSYTYTSAKKVATFKVSINLSSIWLDVYSETSTYDASGYLIQSLSKVLDFTTMSLENDSRNTYTNDASGNATVQMVESWNTTDMVWEKSINYLNQYDAANNRLISIEQTWNTADAKFDTSSRTRSTYNAFNQLTSDAIASWDGVSAWELNDSTTYYYEDYTVSSIKKDVLSTSDAKVYPIPANDVLNIIATVDHTQNVQIALLDIQGRVIMSQSVMAIQQLNQKVPVSNIPSGNYLLQLKGDKGFDVVKQISIAH